MKQVERVSAVPRLWTERKPEKRDGSEVLMFHTWLIEHRPALLDASKGDWFQVLKSDLTGLRSDK